MNDDRSPLLDLMNCIVCNQAMKLEKIDLDDQGDDIIQYRRKLCGRIASVSPKPRLGLVISLWRGSPAL
jgi:hypothetical protein